MCFRLEGMRNYYNWRLYIERNFKLIDESILEFVKDGTIPLCTKDLATEYTHLVQEVVQKCIKLTVYSDIFKELCIRKLSDRSALDYLQADYGQPTSKDITTAVKEILGEKRINSEEDLRKNMEVLRFIQVATKSTSEIIGQMLLAKINNKEFKDEYYRNNKKVTRHL